MDFVLDASTAIRWCLLAQQTKVSQQVLSLMESSEAVVPTVWPLEVANVIRKEVQKGSLTEADSKSFFDLLRTFQVFVLAGSEMWKQFSTLPTPIA